MKTEVCVILAKMQLKGFLTLSYSDVCLGAAVGILEVLPLTDSTKSFTFSLEIKLEEKFGLISQELDISKRQPVHLALRQFIDQSNK